LTFLGQNPPFEPRPKTCVLPPVFSWNPSSHPNAGPLLQFPSAVESRKAVLVDVCGTETGCQAGSRWSEAKGDRSFRSLVGKPARIASRPRRFPRIHCVSGAGTIARLDRASPSEGEVHTFESYRVRHFGTELGTPKPAFLRFQQRRSYAEARTLPEPRKTRLHLVLTQCADIDSRADRPSKPCLLLSCYQAVGGLRSGVPFSLLAKLRSDKSQAQRADCSFRAD
jgi:hypothetical protein